MAVRTNPVSVTLLVVLALLLSALLAGCGSGSTEGSADGDAGNTSGERASGEATERTSTTEENPLTPAEATIGPDENSSMVPAGGEEPDPAQPPPENPPEGVKTYPATTNDTVSGEVDYERTPPTNGDHDPLWQNCGFYEEPVRDETAVHSLDHGAVWITYRPGLPQEQVETLRVLAEERYVLVSPYPDQPSPVTATAWRNQLRLENTDDPRLDQFVEQFRISQTAPLSGNGCTGGVGEPA